MKLIIVRHGQTEENKNNIWQGWLDSKLNKKGKKQAGKLVSILEKENIDTIYCSDLQRAKNTIEPFLENRKIPIHYVKELRERNLGVLEGATTEQKEEYVKKNKIDFTTSNLETGETFQEVKERASKLYQEVLNKHKDGTVLFVTHGGLVSQLIMYVFNHPPDRFREFLPDNASVTKIEVKEGKPRLLIFNGLL